MGVSGCGKTRVGEILADKIRGLFFDGDDFNPASNIEKMSRSIPLNDSDREVWLKKMRKLIEKQLKLRGYSVFACSALKKQYREILQCNDSRIKYVYLKGSYAMIKERLGKRKGHYMKPSLLESQFATIEEPQNAMVMEITARPEKIAALIVKDLKLYV